jgi:hypothetical protein
MLRLLFLTVKLSKRFILSSPRVSCSMEKNRMSANSRKPCMDWNKLRELCMEELTVFFRVLETIADPNLYIKIVKNHPVILGLCG